MSWLAVTFRFAVTLGGAIVHSRAKRAWLGWRLAVSRVLVCRVVIGGVAGALSSGLALAQDTPRVEVPSECGSASEFVREVAALQRTSRAQLTVSEVVIVRKDDQVWELRLATPEGLRVVADPDCRTLFKTAAVIAATLARPASEPDAAEASAATPAPVGTPSKGAEPGSAAAPKPQATTSQPAGPVRAPATAPEEVDVHSGQSAKLQLGAGAGGYYGLTPDPHLGVEVLAGVVSGRWGGHLAAKILPPRSMTVRGELGLRETVWGARLGASFGPVSWLRGSVGVSAYWISAQGLGINEPLSDSLGLVAPELELAVTALEEPAFRAEFALQGRVGLTKPRFEVEPDGIVYQLPRLGAAGVLRILWTQQ